jgi:rhodanese-related sulfurtransferase
MAFTTGPVELERWALYCYSHVCHLAATAAVLFASKGYPVMELEGGWRWWKNDGFDIEK